MKRLVVYCPGYDLRPVNQSFALIKSEFRNFLKIRQVGGSLTSAETGSDSGDGTATWDGRVDWPEGTVETRFVQLGWRDVIKPDFERGWFRIMTDALWSFYLYARAGGYGAVLKSNWAHSIFVLYPAVGFALYCAVSLVPPLLLAPFVLENVGAIAPAGIKSSISWLVLLVGSGLWMAAVYGFTRLIEPWTYFWYLVNSWYFMARLARNAHPDILERIEEFADTIAALSEQADDDEELVLVSHSCGTFVAIYILAAVLRRKPDIGQRAGGFSFVTLGPAFECLGGFGADQGFGQAMATVARAEVDWTDIYGPQDIVCGGRTSPVARYASRAGKIRASREPRRFSVCIPERMPAETLRYLRFRFFRLHFCYFLASLRPDLFDFYRLMLGPEPAVKQLQAWAGHKG
ncbi:hypothetical protein [Roseibium aggregatum]|uniref:Uncharacterized protein n=1 Tax=Roseibium aggregatum TaxID=187304 RepID=A0A926NZM3_9HYPH|nr:hypothetical protein [Roseibium aggregatum]MBD1549319.1 hypothetical protein [Roseibium aggregatum]